MFGSEDCLFVNVWAPPEVPAEGVPVMVWIHGGGNVNGHGGLYDFSQMAERFDLVMLTFNYRLGGLGWFYHPALWTEKDGALDRSGNFGLLDQVALLRWVQENVGVFGGDPDRVTVFGESAGGQDTLALMVSPVSAGLFHGAIAQSGYTSSVTLAEASLPVDTTDAGKNGSSGEMLLHWLQESGQADSREAAAKKSQSMSNEEIDSFLRSLSTTDVAMAYYDEENRFAPPIMIRDGVVIPIEGTAAAYRDGKVHRVPLISGTNRDENNLWLAFTPELVNNRFGMFYRAKDENRYRFFSEYRAKGWKARGADDPSRWVRARGGKAFAYRWDWDEEPNNIWGNFALLVGAAHGLETMFLTGVFPDDGPASLLFNDANAAGRLELSHAMQSYWAEFAYTGSPGRGRGKDLPDWKEWNLEPGAEKFIILDTSSGGGIRMSDREIFLDALLMEAAIDERVPNLEDLCWLVYLNLKEDPFFVPALYQDWNEGKCQAYSAAHFDAKAD